MNKYNCIIRRYGEIIIDMDMETPLNINESQLAVKIGFVRFMIEKVQTEDMLSTFISMVSANINSPGIEILGPISDDISNSQKITYTIIAK